VVKYVEAMTPATWLVRTFNCVAPAATVSPERFSESVHCADLSCLHNWNRTQYNSIISTRVKVIGASWTPSETRDPLT